MLASRPLGQVRELMSDKMGLGALGLWGTMGEGGVTGKGDMSKATVWLD